MAAEEAVGHVFTLSDGQGVRCAEFFGLMAAMCDGTVRTLPIQVAAPLADAVASMLRRIGQKSDLSGGTMWLLNRPGTYSIEKARRMLGFQPLVSTEEGMARVAEWARREGLIDA